MLGSPGGGRGRGPIGKKFSGFDQKDLASAHDSDAIVSSTVNDGIWHLTTEHRQKRPFTSVTRYQLTDPDTARAETPSNLKVPERHAGPESSRACFNGLAPHDWIQKVPWPSHSGIARRAVGGRSRGLSVDKTRTRIPSLQAQGVQGGTLKGRMRACGGVVVRVGPAPGPCTCTGSASRV